MFRAFIQLKRIEQESGEVPDFDILSPGSLHFSGVDGVA